jgi:hypothetical protein
MIFGQKGMQKIRVRVQKGKEVAEPTITIGILRIVDCNEKSWRRRNIYSNQGHDQALASSCHMRGKTKIFHNVFGFYQFL